MRNSDLPDLLILYHLYLLISTVSDPSTQIYDFFLRFGQLKTGVLSVYFINVIFLTFRFLYLPVVAYVALVYLCFVIFFTYKVFWSFQ